MDRDWEAKIIKEMFALIAEHGWAVQGVFDPRGRNPSRCYTVGLMDKQLPELFLQGLEPRLGQKLLNHLAQCAVDGKIQLVVGAQIEISDGVTVRLDEMRDTSRMRFAKVNAQALLKRLRALEVVLPPDVLEQAKQHPVSGPCQCMVCGVES